MKWELFVDESGRFAKDEHCLVGGMLCPAGSMNESLVRVWKAEILADESIQKAISAYGNWKFDHCSENPVMNEEKKKYRHIIQEKVVKEYAKKLQSIGGKIVIFDNPKGVYNVDNTTNYLTVLAKGLLMLFYQLQNELESLRVYFAERKNITRSDPSEEYSISPTRAALLGMADERVIIEKQYEAVLQNLAFLQGGQWLLENKTFLDTISNVKILRDRYIKTSADAPFSLVNGKYVYVRTGGNYDSVSNPLTVPCDYICNTFFNINDAMIRRNQSVLQEGFLSIDNFIWFDTDRPINPRDVFEGVQQTRNITLVDVVSADFPEPASTDYFDKFNSFSKEEQRNEVSMLIGKIREQVLTQKGMPLLVERLKHAIDSGTSIVDEDIRNIYTANMMLFQISLYTHMGNHASVEELNTAVHLVIDQIINDDERDTLLDIADNRRIVELTDLFDYEAAIKCFDESAKYWISRINNRRNKTSHPVYPVYGRLIGSYLQVLRHYVHMFTGDDKALYYSEAKEKYDTYIWHLHNDLVDISRCHQTICDIESEMGHFDEAIKHIYYASQLDISQKYDYGKLTMPSYMEIGDAIFASIGKKEIRHPYMLQHFLRLLSTMGEQLEKQDLLEQLGATIIPHISLEIGYQINNPHPRTQSQWKAASLLAWRKLSTNSDRTLASKLFDNAANTLLSYETPVFTAIAVAVRAEKLLHITMDHIAGNKSVALKQLISTYERFLFIKDDNMINPFKELLKTDLSVEDLALSQLYAVIHTIGY